MAVKARFVAIVIALVVMSQLASCARRDFDTLCQLAKGILAEPRVAPAERWRHFLTQQEHFAGGRAVDAVDAAKKAQTGKRTEAFLRVVHAHVPQWRCAALRPVLDSTLEVEARGESADSAPEEPSP